jgi:hypothetical protein
MNVLVAIFVAGVGIYTIYRAPRSLPHWLAGFAAFTFSFATSMAKDVHSHQRILWACAAYFATFTHIIINQRTNVAALSATILQDICMLALGTAAGGVLFLAAFGSIWTGNAIVGSMICLMGSAWLIVFPILNVQWNPPSGWRSLHFFNFGALWSVFIVTVPLTVFLVLAFPLLAAYFIMAEMKTETVLRRLAVACNAVAFLLLIANYAASSSTVLIYDATRFGTPVLLSIGVLLTCIAMIHLISRQPNPVFEAVDASGQANPL